GAEIFITVGTKLWWGGHRLADCLEPGDTPFELAQLGFMDDAAIAFTSGSTGTPKGVAYHQGMWDTAVKSIREMMDMKAGDVSVQAFAAFAIYDLCWGHTAVIPAIDLSKPAKAPPEAFATAIRHHQAKMAFASPIIWRRVAPFCQQKGWKLESLDKAITTGAPTPPEMVRAFAPLLRDGVEFHTPYGATEAIPVSHIGSAELMGDCLEKTARGAGTCVGHPAPGIDVRIARVTDDAIPAWSEDLRLPDGEIGEIVVSGGQVSVDYKESPEGNASSKIRDGERILHRMGDLGYLDPQGRIWFCGRKSHRLQTKDGMLPCVPVEGITNEHPDVFRTALVGVGEPGAEEPVLIVEMQKGKTFTPGTADALKALTVGTPYEHVFAQVLPHPGFPTDARHNSKIRRGDLRTWATRQLR
ncbi:MAG: AMP-binding protein, partial [Myxococcales bacterium]|nr:AMP-binding protein [Myxococcales bacterium]